MKFSEQRLQRQPPRPTWPRTSKKVQTALENPIFTSPEGREALEAERKLMEFRSSLTKAQSLAKEAERRLSPVSVLVSKRDKKVYIRQALAPLFEAPVAIRDPETPLGTHVYIATSSNGDALGWSVVSFPSWSRGADWSMASAANRTSPWMDYRWIAISSH